MNNTVMRLIGGLSAVVIATSSLTSPAQATSLIDYGSIGGKVVTNQGKPLRDVYVELRRNGNRVANTATGTNGRYRFTQVEPGIYAIKFRYPSGHEVWFDNAVDEYHATPITVTANANTVVNATRPPVGHLNIEALDDTTGQVVSGVCFYYQDGPFNFPTTCTGTDGVAQLRDVPVGTYNGGSYDQGGVYENGLLRNAVVTEGATTRVTVRLRKWGKINVTFVDAVTGDPAGACLYLADAVRSELGGNAPCGQTVSWPNTPAMNFRLFASPYDGVHGAQWVGPNGGVGDPTAAQRFALTWGQQLDIVVRLDGAGSITGTITDAATEAGVMNACPTVGAPKAGYGESPNSHCTYSNGTYTIRDLGPYQWKLAFPTYSGNYAWVWSGGAANRNGASPLTVVAGETLTYNVALPPSAAISGTVTGSDIPCIQCTYIVAVDADTGDYAGISPYVYPDGTYTIKGLNNQSVWVEYSYSSDVGMIRYPQQLQTAIGTTITGIDLPVPA